MTTGRYSREGTLRASTISVLTVIVGFCGEDDAVIISLQQEATTGICDGEWQKCLQWLNNIRFAQVVTPVHYCHDMTLKEKQ